MKTGISLYLGSGYEENMKVLEKAKRAGVGYAFTSLHIPEESCEDYAKEAGRLLKACREYGLRLIMDVGPRTLEKLSLKNFDELYRMNVTHIRLDYGFSMEEMRELSRKFHIVLNASTTSWEELGKLRRGEVDFSRLAACHNFYPKPLTGLSIEKTEKINQNFHMAGIETMAFVAGDKKRRGPLFMGLPTVEEHRDMDAILSILELRRAGTDIVMVGDIDCEDTTWERMYDLANGYISLRARLSPEYESLYGTIHHDRPDSSAYVIRSQESRGYASLGRSIEPIGSMNRERGSISIGNDRYARYTGEMEIARRDLNPEERVNIIGYVKEEDRKYLDYIDDGFGFRLIQEE